MTRNKVQISAPRATPEWSLLTKHGRVLLSVARDPQMRLRDIAVAVDLTERRVHTILSDLVESGHVIKAKDGRRNRYEVNGQQPVPDFVAQIHPISEFVQLLAPETPT
ncbi:MAG TPA: ArsR family transcriptional regulator [Acidimicrobiales bacterium]|nr:ArsR family transcriptional regulator [Acidimicrobiales bacterium]